MYIPDKWLIVKINEDLYKVFATWSSDYIYGDSWKINSGIVRVEESEDFYDFYGYSGSCYHCRKSSYGSTGFGYSILDTFIEKTKDIAKFEILEDCNWCEISY